MAINREDWFEIVQANANSARSNYENALAALTAPDDGLWPSFSPRATDADMAANYQADMYNAQRQIEVQRYQYCPYLLMGAQGEGWSLHETTEGGGAYKRVFRVIFDECRDDGFADEQLVAEFETFKEMRAFSSKVVAAIEAAAARGYHNAIRIAYEAGADGWASES